MVRICKPRSGSLAFYPNKRANKITPNFNTFPNLNGVSPIKPANFIGFKVGMVHIMAMDVAEKTTSFKQEIVVPCTIIECPPLKVYGVRAYKNSAYGKKAFTDVLVDKLDKNMKRKLKGKKLKKNDSKRSQVKTFGYLEQKKDEFDELFLLAATQPGLTGIGKKKPDLFEVKISGKKDEQINFAKENFGKEIKISDVFNEGDFADVKSVTKGKGFAGVVKKAGVKIQRRKAKYQRKVGSISPWHPPLVMWTVARPGRMGFQYRTEYNKRIIKIGTDLEINPKGGFVKYGNVKNDYLLIAGSIPGSNKRPVALRFPIRKVNDKNFKLGSISYVSSKPKVIA